MTFFANPRNLGEAYGIATWIYTLSGLFPFYFDVAKKKMQISWKFFLLTIIHISVYTYVNVTSLMENWHNYAQPMLGNSSLTAMGNLLLRVLGVIITFSVLAPLLIGSTVYVTSLNVYNTIFNDLTLMGIDVNSIYRRIYFSSVFSSLFVAGILLFTAWHSIYFYELLTERPPELKFYLVAFLSNYYKILFLSYGYIQLGTVYMISKQLNCFLHDIVKEKQENFEAEKRVKNTWAKKINSIY